MSALTLRWVGPDEYDRVAETRMYCYAAGRKELQGYQDRLRADVRVKPGDCLLAEQDGRAVGTATSLSLRMWVRGALVPCQGVASVGTIKTHRRSGHSSHGPGVATRIMHDVLRRARERGEVVSALMPFRGSFYEHFGYGIMERRCDWTVPLAVLPQGSSAGVRYYEPADLAALADCRQRVAQLGQCDIERSLPLWERYITLGGDGFQVVDQPNASGPVHGWLHFERQRLPDGRDVAKVVELGYEDVPALKRMLHFLGNLRDQFSIAIVPLPADLPLNWLLKEVQMTHRDARNHPTAEARPYTRMQVRVLDHKRFVESMRLPTHVAGRTAVVVQESEGQPSRFTVEFSGGAARVTHVTSASPAAFECRDPVWAAIACGDLRATRAVELGLARSPDLLNAALLDAFAAGPVPYCLEYF